MHAIYTTPGFIVGSGQYGEAGKLISIFTREMGLVRAVAQGIRFEKSKLRYHTTDYSFGTFSLVRGKEVWRLTSAQSNFASSPNNDGLVQSFWAQISVLLRRLLQGEEANAQLFDALLACNTFLKEVDIDKKPDLDTVESLLVIRILHTLGYIGDDKDIHGFIYSNDFTPSLLDLAMRKRTSINQHINKALKESHL
ncbi:MAG: recombination protein O N-terminal domain-containing protein [Candidatus Taylorbacteria bacterium]